MMRAIGWAVGIAALAAGATNIEADARVRRVGANLEPQQEVPAVSSPASGQFRAVIDDVNDTVDFELTYQNLQADIRQVHIHFAQRNVNGGIMVWLCGSATNPGPPGTQVCPQSGTVTGTITSADVLAITTQGIAAGEFDEFVAALRSGQAYANVHTQQSPGGEIRGQIRHP